MSGAFYPAPPCALSTPLGEASRGRLSLRLYPTQPHLLPPGRDPFQQAEAMMRAFFDDPFFGPPRVQQGQGPQAHPGGQQQPYAGGGQVGPGQCAARVLGLAGGWGRRGRATLPL